MRLTFVLLACAVLFARAEEEDNIDETHVTVLTDKNFDTFVSAELSLVEFYAPWCGHCKAIKPKFAEAATQLAGLDTPIHLGKLDATAFGDVSSKYGVSGYPTLKIFRYGKEADYTGGREAGQIVSYMKKMFGPAAKSLTSAAEVEDFLKSDTDNNYAVVGYFYGGVKKPSQLYSAFTLVSTKLRDTFVFGKVTDASVGKAMGQEADAIVAYRESETPQVYQGKTKTSLVEAWVRKHSIALVGEYTSEQSGVYYGRGLPVVRCFISVDQSTSPNAKQYKYYFNRLKKLAVKFEGELVFAIADKETFSDEMADLGMAEQEMGLVVQESEYAEHKYTFEDTFNVKNAAAWLQTYLDDELDPYVKSEPVPADNTGPVTVVVGKTFDSIVNNPEKDVLIEFYAPWCGHCQALVPKFEKLGRTMKKHENVVVAKIDATANYFDRSTFEVSGYPTLYFVAAKAGATPIKYEGDREVGPMAKFLKKKAKTIKKKKKTKDEL